SSSSCSSSSIPSEIERRTFIGTVGNDSPDSLDPICSSPHRTNHTTTERHTHKPKTHKHKSSKKRKNKLKQLAREAGLDDNDKPKKQRRRLVKHKRESDTSKSLVSTIAEKSANRAVQENSDQQLIAGAEEVHSRLRFAIPHRSYSWFPSKRQS